MQFEILKHPVDDHYIAELINDECVINGLQDSLDLIGNVYYDGVDRLIVHQHQIIPDFFVLKNKLAGEILQKFSNFRLRLAIVGTFDELTEKSKSLHDFISESNKGNMVGFVGSRDDAFAFLCR